MTFSVSDLPLLRDSVVLLSLTLVGAALTVTTNFAVLPPAAVAVMVAVPVPFAVTLPLLSTVATVALLVVHFTVVLTLVVAFRAYVSPLPSVAFAAFSLMV